MSSLAAPYTVPQAGHMVCVFWMTIQPNGCSTPAPTYSPGAPPQLRGGKRHRPSAPERGEKKENETKIKLETKKKKLEAQVDSEEYYIVAVSVTWFKEESNWRTGLAGYKVYRCDRKERIGGVAAICVKDSIASRERGDIKEGIYGEDSVWVEIRGCKNSNILVGWMLL